MSESEISEHKRRGFVARNIFVLLLAGLLVVSSVVVLSNWLGQRSSLDADRAQVSTLDEQVRVAQLEASEHVAADLLTSLGVNQGRITQDARVIEQFVDTAFTWDSGLAYEQARAELQEEHDLDPEGDFLSAFMPPAKYNEDADGKKYYSIDGQGLISSVGDDPLVQVVGVQAGDYEYVVLVDVAMTSGGIERNQTQPEKVTAHRMVLLHLMINADGDVIAVSAASARGETRHSG